ncbi:MAG: Uncharacterised protein [Cellulomonadaceae bacterium TMED98]|nr:MAG: Uncharacterised protein [Cellulomonadaceae bacterium TMED98]
MSRLDRFDSPKIKRIARHQVIGVTAPPAKTDTANHLVHPATQGPGTRQGIPAVVTANRFDCFEQGVGRGLGGHPPNIGIYGVTGPLGVAWQRVCWRARDFGIPPGRLHRTVSHFSQRQADRSVISREAFLGRRNDLVNVVVFHDRVVQQRLDNRHRQSPGNRGNEVDPLTGKPRRQHRQRGDGTLLQTRFQRITVHELAVAEHIGSPDIEGAVDRGVEVHRVQQVVQDISNRDGLDEVTHPFGRWHIGKDFGEVSNHFEARRARADDDSRLEHDGGNRTGEQNIAHFFPRLQVSRQLAFWMKTAQIHNPLDPGCFARPRHVVSNVPLELVEISRLAHRMDQVIDQVLSGHGVVDSGPVFQIAHDHPDVFLPRHIVQAVGIPDNHRDVVTLLQQPRHQASSHIPRRAGHQCFHTPHPMTGR